MKTLPQAEGSRDPKENNSNKLLAANPPDGKESEQPLRPVCSRLAIPPSAPPEALHLESR